MFVFLLTQDNVNGYDTFDSAVVVAKSPAEARVIHPSGDMLNSDGVWDREGLKKEYWTWPLPLNVHVQFIGTAKLSYTEPTVICSSYNAG